MAKLMIKCPETGKPVFTGMDVPKGTDLSGLSKNSPNSPNCPHIHTWDGKDAYFD